MTKPRSRRARGQSEIAGLVWRFFCDALTPEDEAGDTWTLLGLRHDIEHLIIVSPPLTRPLSETWHDHEAEIVAWWIEERPGTRPTCWWRYSAPEPRQSHESEAGYLKRLGLFRPGEEKRLRPADFAGRAN
jgi:hypothetical protein